MPNIGCCWKDSKPACFSSIDVAKAGDSLDAPSTMIGEYFAPLHAKEERWVKNSTRG